MSLNVYLWVSAIIVLSVILLLLPSFESPANAADRNWRYNEHGRNIDIDICVMCTQPGPQGPQGPPGDTRQTIVTLHDDAEGNAAGWNPPLEPNNNLFMIKAPFELVYQAILVKENASAVEQTRHIWLLLREELLIRNGIIIPSKKIVGYAEDATGTFCIERRFLQVMFAEAFV